MSRTKPNVAAPSTLKECRIQVALGLLYHAEYIITVTLHNRDEMLSANRTRRHLVHVYGLIHNCKWAAELLAQDITMSDSAILQTYDLDYHMDRKRFDGANILERLSYASRHSIEKNFDRIYHIAPTPIVEEGHELQTYKVYIK